MQENAKKVLDETADFVKQMGKRLIKPVNSIGTSFTNQIS